MASPSHGGPLSVQVLETCVNHCGEKFHNEVAKFRFLNELIKVLSPKVSMPRAWPSLCHSRCRFPAPEPVSGWREPCFLPEEPSTSGGHCSRMAGPERRGPEDRPAKPPRFLAWGQESQGMGELSQMTELSCFEALGARPPRPSALSSLSPLWQLPAQHRGRGPRRVL